MTNREMKSKVMALGNRRAARMDRQEAFRRITRYNPAQIRAFIVPEPGNAADRKAAAVMVGVQNGRDLYRPGICQPSMRRQQRALKPSLLKC